MNTPALSQIEESIDQLTLIEQLLLIERLANRIRQSTTMEQSIWENQLIAMAADPEIQDELRKIEEEFASTELDGLDIN